MPQRDCPDQDFTDYVSRAEALFNEFCLATKSAGSEEIFTTKACNADVFWSSPESYENPVREISGIEIPIESPSLYRVIRSDSSAVWCRVELLYVKTNEGNDAVYLMYYVPADEYASTHPASIEDDLGNGGDMKDYSGLKIYTTIDGYFVRINRYRDGICREGVFLGNLETEQEKIEAYESFVSLLGGMTIQRYRKGSQTKGGIALATNEVPDDFELDAAVCIADKPGCGAGGGSNVNFWLFCASFDRLNEMHSGNENAGNQDAMTHNGGGGSGSAGKDSVTDPSESRVQEEIDFETDKFEEDTVKVDIKDLKEKLKSKITVKGLCDTSNATALKNLIDTLLTNHSKNRLIVNVLDGIKDKLKSVEIFSEVEHNRSSSNKVFIRQDCVKDTLIVFEEFFHVYQRNTDKWSSGNLEFEAKIYDCLLSNYITGSIEGVFNLFGDKNVKAWLSFYKNPNNESYKDAKQALQDIGYPISEYPDSLGKFNNYSEMLKHIRGLEKAENGL